MSGIVLPPFIAHLFANKLYLFACYALVFCLLEYHALVGASANIALLFAHAHFLSITETKPVHEKNMQ